MKNYLFMLFAFVFMALVSATPVLALNVSDHVELHIQSVIVPTQNVVPPDIGLEQAIIIYNKISEEVIKPTCQLDLPIPPRPGWQSESAREAYNKKRELLLAQENKI